MISLANCSLCLGDMDILTCKRLLVDIFLIRRLSKSLAFCEFASANFRALDLVSSSVSLLGALFVSVPVPLSSFFSHALAVDPGASSQTASGALCCARVKCTEAVLALVWQKN